MMIVKNNVFYLYEILKKKKLTKSLNVSKDRDFPKMQLVKYCEEKRNELICPTGGGVGKLSRIISFLNFLPVVISNCQTITPLFHPAHQFDHTIASSPLLYQPGHKPPFAFVSNIRYQNACESTTLVEAVSLRYAEERVQCCRINFFDLKKGTFSYCTIVPFHSTITFK